MVEPDKVALYIPPGLQKFKLALFERIGQKIGRVVREDLKELEELPDDIVPIVGCTPALRPIINHWHATGRKWIYWDRGYARRVFATWLPKGSDMGIPGGYYRWHIRHFQLGYIRNLPSDRWDKLKIEARPWKNNPKGHVIIAHPTPTYSKFHQIEGWTDNIIRKLSLITDAQLVVRDKETKRPLQKDVEGARCLVAHGSNAAVEAAILGCPVIVHKCSAASLVGVTDLGDIRNLKYPDRQAWFNSLAYSQFTEEELVDGTMWRLLT